MTFSLHIGHTCSWFGRQGESAVVSDPLNLSSLSLQLQRIKKLQPAIEEEYKHRRQNMVHGKLEVLLVSAKGLEDTDFLNNMDPFVILTCRTQEQKSSVANGAGSEPEWNETFIFTVSDETPQLHLKIMDSDLTNDDFVGEATIPLEAVFQEGSLPPAVHPVVKEEKYCGEIKLALTFTPAVETRRPDDSSWS